MMQMKCISMLNTRGVIEAIVVIFLGLVAMGGVFLGCNFGFARGRTVACFRSDGVLRLVGVGYSSRVVVWGHSSHVLFGFSRDRAVFGGVPNVFTVKYKVKLALLLRPSASASTSCCAAPHPWCGAGHLVVASYLYCELEAIVDPALDNGGLAMAPGS
jgi:hypothetical protein